MRVGPDPQSIPEFWAEIIVSFRRQNENRACLRMNVFIINQDPRWEWTVLATEFDPDGMVRLPENRNCLKSVVSGRRCDVGHCPVPGHGDILKE